MPTLRLKGHGWWGGFSVLQRLNGKPSRPRTASAARGGLAALALVAVAGCSVHPLPDDVSPIATEEIVKSARCEMRLGLFEHIERVLKRKQITQWKARDLESKEGWERFYAWLKAHVKQKPQDKELMDKLHKYAQVAAAYDFDFNILEHNHLDAGVGFRNPLKNSILDLSAGGAVDASRRGQRTFKAQETFAQLVSGSHWCDRLEPRDQNLAYPITGSIGLRKVVETFVEISEQGGGKDSFVDTLTFTTTISGSVGASLKINPVPNSFRLVSAGGLLAADRTDVHKVVISLAFPQDKKKRGEVLDKEQKELDKQGLLAPYELNTLWRARYNICVTDARNREDALKTLRLQAPEVYCMTYADAFVPRYTDSRVRGFETRRW
jgi:hypothetical protein